jgi:broad specificity phosphatase PhoE
MTKLILIRHGETDWNIEGRWQGQEDVPLNGNGIQQAEANARELHSLKIDAIYSSDLGRARQTAEIIGKEIGLRVFIDVRLREIHQGAWQGMLITDIEERYAEIFKNRRADPLNFAPPGGETGRQVQERVIPAIQEIIQTHPHQTIVVVSHGFVIAVLMTWYKNLSFQTVWHQVPKNGERIELEFG